MIQKGNLGQFIESKIELFGHKTALVFENKGDDSINISFAKLGRAINRVANLLCTCGVQKGDRVYTQINNCPEVVYLYFAVAKIGAVLVPTNVYNSLDEAAFCLKLTRPKFVLIEEHLIEQFKNLSSKIEGLKDKIFVGRDSANQGDFHNFSHLAKNCKADFVNDASIKPGDLFEIIFTSGTTQSPKGVMISHHNALFASYYSAWQYALRNDDVFLTCYPAYHVDFQFTGLLPCLGMGATFIALEKYSSRGFWAKVCTYKATITEVIPKMINTLLLQKKKSWELNHNLREVLFFLNLPLAKMQSFSQRFKVPLFTSYGLSESIVGVLGDRPGDIRKWPSIGRVGFSYEVRICKKNTTHELKPHEIGEICIKGIRGENMFLGYYKDEDKTAKCFDKEGYFHTGDMGYMDEAGYFYFVDRCVNVIKTSGENVSSSQVESVIASHEGVVESAVVGVINEIGDEVIKAFVVRKDKSLNEGDIKEYCSLNLARFKVPCFVEFIDKLPRNAVGKIDKKVLRSCELPRKKQEKK